MTLYDPLTVDEEPWAPACDHGVPLDESCRACWATDSRAWARIATALAIVGLAVLLAIAWWGD